MRRPPAVLMLVALAAAAPVRAEDPAPEAGTALKLEAARPVEITCQTKSVVVKENAANATTGALKLTLLLKDAASRPAKGAWRIASVDEKHTGSLGQREAKTCAEGCPLSVAADGNIELWSPAPKAFDKLSGGEMLLLAVIKSKSLDLRATTFSGKEIESLEEGTCRSGP
ncbi:MAG: hypothetical protein MUC37_00805 [Hyphomicrobium sp.]|nr:hypothetical protein [Hyphomicrobium sp.]